LNKFNFCYLVQGQAKEMPYFQDVLYEKHYKLLTWDAPFEGSIFFPNSSWAEGRKKLEEEINIDDYEYVCFIDGDVQIKSGSLDEFEKIVSTLKPVCAVPVADRFSRSVNRFNTKSKWMISFGIDEQFQVFSVKAYKELFNSKPYITKFDTLSWHFPCMILQTVLGSIFKNNVITVKTLKVKNNNSSDYPKSKDFRLVKDYLNTCGFKPNFYPLLKGYQHESNNLIRVVFKLINFYRLFLCSYFNEFLFKNVDSVLGNKSKNFRTKCLFN
jgi:hypothetical protein